MITPVGDKILVRPLPSNISTLLEVPDHYLTSESLGEVVRLGTYFLAERGQGKFRRFNTDEYPDAWPCKVGDKVSFSNLPGIGMKMEDDEGNEILLMHVGQIRAIIEAEV